MGSEYLPPRVSRAALPASARFAIALRRECSRRTVKRLRLQLLPHIVGDSAFPRPGCVEERILTSPSASDLPFCFPSFAQPLAAYLVSKVVVYVRQSAEWGMRGLQGSFNILHHCLPSDHHYRGAMIKALLHAMNFKTRTGGANQILRFSDSRNVALERMSRAAERFLMDR
jgi:hypothetical protein